jgi:hypothetical protein
MPCKVLYSGEDNEIGQIFMSARILVSGFFGICHCVDGLVFPDAFEGMFCLLLQGSKGPFLVNCSSLGCEGTTFL